MEVRNMARRRFTLDDKIKVIEELNSGVTNAQVCKKYELSPSTLSTFKRQTNINQDRYDISEKQTQNS